MLEEQHTEEKQQLKELDEKLQVDVHVLYQERMSRRRRRRLGPQAEDDSRLHTGKMKNGLPFSEKYICWRILQREDRRFTLF